jgi:hypothetical protein
MRQQEKWRATPSPPYTAKIQENSIKDPKNEKTIQSDYWNNGDSWNNGHLEKYRFSG